MGQKGETGETGLTGETGKPGNDGVSGTKGNKVGFMQKTNVVVYLFVCLLVYLFDCRSVDSLVSWFSVRWGCAV